MSIKKLIKKVVSPEHNPLLVNMDKIQVLEPKPFISVHVALYNEKRVVERLIRACTNQKWFTAAGPVGGSSRPTSSATVTSNGNQNPDGGLRALDGTPSAPATRKPNNYQLPTTNYELIIADDSNDETTEIAKKTFLDGGWVLASSDGEADLEYFVFTKTNAPTVKLIHRFSRSGYKGAALHKALERTSGRAEYIVIMDADFVPYPDTIEQFVKTFQVVGAASAGGNIAAVQGYQWHVLNKSQTWVTRGVRTEYAGSYVIERTSEQIYGGLKQIAGSVYAIRADVLRKFGWGTSITEDFELTLRLYEAGYKVLFTPYIQAPAEAVATVNLLIRQRMRWAEGASYNIKVMFWRIMKSPNMTRSEKMEFVYFAFYYLQAAFFVIGTFAWFISEAVLGARLPFWTAAFGWSLVFTNLFALPLMNIVGLFLEESDERDYVGILSFIALSYIVVPFQAYAAIKGFMQSSEGPWFRTPKTGAITDVFGRPGFGKFFGNIFGKPAPVAVQRGVGSAFNNFSANLAVVSQVVTSRKGWPWTAKSVLVVLLVFTTTLFYVSHGIPLAEATNMAGPLKLSPTVPDQTPPVYANSLTNEQTYASASTLWPVGNNTYSNLSNNKYWFDTNLIPTGVTNAVIPGGNYYVQFAKQGNGSIGGTNSSNIFVQLYLTSSNGTARTILGSNTYIMRQNNANNNIMQFYIGNLVGNQITSAAKNRLGFWLFASTATAGCRNNSQCYWNMAINNTNLPARLIIPTAGVTVPEIPKPLVMVILLVVMPVMPGIVSGRYRKRGRNVICEFGMAWKDLIKKLLGSDFSLDELPV